MDSILASHPGALGLKLGVLKNFSFDFADIYLQHCLEQWPKA